MILEAGNPRRLRGLPGGGRSPAKPVSHAKFPVFSPDQGIFLWQRRLTKLSNQENGQIVSVLRMPRVNFQANAAKTKQGIDLQRTGTSDPASTAEQGAAVVRRCLSAVAPSLEPGSRVVALFGTKQPNSRGRADFMLEQVMNEPIRHRSLAIEMIDLSALRPYAKNARRHSRAQIKQIAKSIEAFGFTNPILVSDELEILAGHGRAAAAELIGMSKVPVVRLSNLSPAERRAYVLADNKLALNAGWDREVLAIELQGLIDLGFEVEMTGFALGEIEVILEEAAESDPNEALDGAEDEIPVVADTAVSRSGDVWRAGRHRVLCGDARDKGAYQALLGDERIDLIFTDPPYNVPIDGHVCGLGRVRHREFAMGVGEMSSQDFRAFLEQTLGPAGERCRDGAIAFVCMDWRHAEELIVAGKAVFSELKNLCVWNKSNAGMGSFYRSKHELVFVFKKGTAPHTNTFGLGETGRPRSNVWDYPGVSSLGPRRMEELAMHPTVKPTRLVADAIKDCSRRGDLVLDPFGGSGTTLIAAEKTGRSARLIEFDPAYCDMILRRFERVTGKQAILSATSETFEDVEQRRDPVSFPAGSAL
jgi:DNA modification methylase